MECSCHLVCTVILSLRYIFFTSKCFTWSNSLVLNWQDFIIPPCVGKRDLSTLEEWVNLGEEPKEKLPESEEAEDEEIKGEDKKKRKKRAKKTTPAAAPLKSEEAGPSLILARKEEL